MRIHETVERTTLGSVNFHNLFILTFSRKKMSTCNNFRRKRKLKLCIITNSFHSISRKKRTKSTTTKQKKRFLKRKKHTNSTSFVSSLIPKWIRKKFSAAIPYFSTIKSFVFAKSAEFIRSGLKSIFQHEQQQPDEIAEKKFKTSFKDPLLPIFVVLRHGERADLHPEEEPMTKTEANTQDAATSLSTDEDPPLTKRGYEKARNEIAPEILRKIIEKCAKKEAEGRIRIKFIISPFLRCLQTAAAVLSNIVCECHDDSEFDVSKIDIDNQWCELFNPLVIKNCKNEETGPALLQDDPSNLLLIDKNDEELTSKIQITNALPTFGETRESGYYRFRRELRENMLNKLMFENSGDDDELQGDNDVVIISTHGDAVNACMLELYGPKRIVFSCDYLAHYFIVPKINQQFGQETPEAVCEVVPPPIPVNISIDNEEKDADTRTSAIPAIPQSVAFLYQQQERNMNPLKFEVEDAWGVEWFDEE